MLLHTKKLYASKEDRATHYLYREAGVLVPHKSEHVAGKQTCSCCSDGFRFHMTEGVFNRCKENGGDETFFHQFKGNGEAMRFALNSPLSGGFSRYGDLDVWGRMKVDEIKEVLGWADDLEVVVEQHRLVHHWPCKAALSRNLDLSQSIDLVIRGKLRIKHQIPDLKVGIDFFIDWDQDDHTTELIKKEPYLQLIETDPRFTKERDEWSAYAEDVKKLPILR
jgi:hypothetical protein